jgi:hypothetical protein
MKVRRGKRVQFLLRKFGDPGALPQPASHS